MPEVRCDEMPRHRADPLLVLVYKLYNDRLPSAYTITQWCSFADATSQNRIHRSFDRDDDA